MYAVCTMQRTTQKRRRFSSSSQSQSDCTSTILSSSCNLKKNSTDDLHEESSPETAAETAAATATETATAQATRGTRNTSSTGSSMSTTNITTTNTNTSTRYLHIGPSGDCWTGASMYAAKHLQPDYVKSFILSFPTHTSLLFVCDEIPEMEVLLVEFLEEHNDMAHQLYDEGCFTNDFWIQLESYYTRRKNE